MNDLTIKKVTYQGETFGVRIRGHLNDGYGRWAMTEKAIAVDGVFIPSSLRAYYTFEHIEPHPECRAKHAPAEVEEWTTFTATIFPHVWDGHRDIVKTFGIRSRVVQAVDPGWMEGAQLVAEWMDDDVRRT
jgi:hypothetical protein